MTRNAQPRIRFTALASKRKMLWVKQAAGYYNSEIVLDDAMGQLDFDWHFAFGHNVRETKAGNERNIPLAWYIYIWTRL